MSPEERALLKRPAMPGLRTNSKSTPRQRLLLCVLALAFLSWHEGLLAAKQLQVAVTLSDILPIVKEIGGEAVSADWVMAPGQDPHSFTITAEIEQQLRQADLIVYAKTDFLSFERKIKEAVPEVPSLDWPDYAAQGAQLREFPGYHPNPHGFWLDLDNGWAIAQAVAAKLRELGVDSHALERNLTTFHADLERTKQAGRDLVKSASLQGATYVLTVPGVAYSIANVGLQVGTTLLSEGAGFVSGGKLNEVVHKLRSRQYQGIVCPISMAQAKPGEIARQLASDTGCEVLYVRFLHGGKGSYTDQAWYNAQALTGRAPAIETGKSTRPSLSSYAGVTVAAIAIVLVILLISIKRRPKQPAAGEQGGAGIFEDDE